MSEITLRAVAAEDVPAMAAVMEGLPEWFTAEAVETVRAVAATLPGIAAVDEAGGVMGFVLWEQRPGECEICWIAVAKERHRQGIGKMLMTQMLALAREGGVERVRVATVAPTEDYEPYARTRAFYEAFGFVIQKMTPAGWPDGTDRADYVLELIGDEGGTIM
jgi:ribosomal protein S18 acetylase RimI-like enzyme